ncbi:penicillin-binding protein 1A [Thermithiobacillus plumbiphilus]|uniref:Penicillin-binding protein 1A n=1 Tax=Thermithiobacillus plumbiphilus TaxID=1729899 RepID=A0ABU9D7F5_9PROT
MTYQRLQSELPDIDPVLNYHPRLPLRIYAADGDLLEEIGPERRAPLGIEQIPERVQQAFLAAEDAHFYEHSGVDLRGIARATWANFRAGNVVQGASTITQQVARNFFLTRDQTYERKIKEALLALKIEQHLSKRQILALYLNQIYLGNGAYGVQAAARRYFNKDVSELNLAQTALLAGMPKAPSAFNPLINPKRALQRRDYVLRRMSALGFVTPAEAEAASQQPLDAGRFSPGRNVAPYVTEEVRQWLVNQLGEDAAYNSGIQIYTSIDINDQEKAQDALVRGLESYDRRHGYRGPVARLSSEAVSAVLAGKRPAELPVKSPAGLRWGLVTQVDGQEATVFSEGGEAIRLGLADVDWARRVYKAGLGPSPKSVKQVLRTGDLIWLRQQEKGWQLAQIPRVQGGFIAMEPTGRIRAMAGGYSFELKQFNHVTDAWRQPGSAFKPFIYAAAMDGDALTAAGEHYYFTPASVLNDGPFQMVDGTGQVWRPSNYGGKSYGPTRLRMALTRSQNLVSIRLLQHIGLPYARNYLQRFGFQPRQLPNGLSLALGSGSVTLLQMAQGYAVFATGGFRPKPYFVERVLDAQGRPLALPDCTPCAEPRPTETVIPPAVAFLATSMLQDVIQHGTGSAARKLEHPDLAGKTGTTNDSHDAWFMGYSPRLVAGAWVGHDQPRGLGQHETGAQVALPIWMDYMRYALKDQPVQEYPLPPDVVTRQISPSGGYLVEAGGIPEYFIDRYPPPVMPRPVAPVAPTESLPAADADTEQLFEQLF